MKPRPRPPYDRATLADVARHAGVSAMTVSRALSRPEKVAVATRERIRGAVETLGYLPDLAAGTLRSRQSRIIAGIVPTLGHSIFSDTVQGISDLLHAEGYQLLLGCSGYALETEEELVSAFLSRRADGVILTGTLHSEPMSDRLRGAGTPVVEMWDSSEPRLDMAVGFSNYRVGFEIGTHLVGCGYRRLGYISTTDAHEAREKRAAERSRGIYAALREAGLAEPARVSVPDPLDIEACGAIAADFAEAHPGLDALICANEIIGAGAIAELRRRGWEVPEWIAVAGIGDAHIADLVSPGLTTVRIHGYEIGRHAAAMLLARLRDQPIAAPCLEVEFEVIARGSTRARGGAET